MSAIRALCCFGIATVFVFVLSGAAPKAKKKSAATNKPCQKVHRACEAAGFRSGKELYIGCMDKVLKGQKVKGVEVAPAILKACQAKTKKRRGA